MQRTIKHHSHTYIITPHDNHINLVHVAGNKVENLTILRSCLPSLLEHLSEHLPPDSLPDDDTITSPIRPLRPGAFDKS